MVMTRSRIKWVLLSTLSLSLAGCLGSPRPPEDRYYYLPETKPDTRLSVPVLNGILGVARLDSDGQRADRPLLYISEERPFEVNKYHYRYWIDSPTVLVQNNIYHYLNKVGFAKSVVRFDPGTQVDYILRGRLLEFERFVGRTQDQVIVGFEIEITRATGEVFIPTTIYRIRMNSERAGSSDETIHKSVIVFDRALRTLLQQFVVANQPANKSHTPSVRKKKPIPARPKKPE